MPIEKHEITSYYVSIVSAKRGPAATIHGLAPNEGGDEAHIYLRFYRDGDARPANSRIEGEDGSLMYMISFAYEQLDSCVDLLRNESPMFFTYNEKSGSGSLATDAEPTGEGPEDADRLRKTEASQG